VEVPALPVDCTAIHLEGHAFGLGDVNRLEVISKANLSLDRLVIIIGGRRLVERSTLLRNVDVDDLLGRHAVDGAKVERVSVLQVVDVGSVVHESLLKSGAICVALVVAWEGISKAPALCYESNIPMVQGSQ
jgi:hypothetical protein